MIEGLNPMPDAVTVLVSTELLAEIEADWSPPVQVMIRRTPGIGSGYEMIARTHECAPPPTLPPMVCRRCFGYGVIFVGPDQHEQRCPDCTPQPDGGASNG